MNELCSLTPIVVMVGATNIVTVLNTSCTLPLTSPLVGLSMVPLVGDLWSSFACGHLDGS